MRADYDVIIVGAGAAGLAAGARLAQSGKRVALLEARDRVGGRIFTRHLPAAEGHAPMSVELGAEFIHGLPPATWSLIGQAKLSAYELEGTELSFIDGRWAPPVNQPATPVIGDMMRWLEARPGCDMSFAEYQAAVPADPATDAAAANYVEGFNAADRHRIGIAALAFQQRAEDTIDADRLFHVAEGYDAVMEFLAKEFRAAGGEIALGAAVRLIEWRRGGVRIEAAWRGASGTGAAATDGRDLRARQALITVPLGVLQADSIAFSPPPAEILEQARRLAMGEVVRVSLVFRERFWRDRRPPSIPADVRRKLADLSFLFTPAEVPPTWWTSNPAPSPILTAWTGGPRATQLRRSIAAGGDPLALPHRCLASLARLFEVSFAELQNQLVSWHEHDWSADPYSLGAYSYVPAGALDAPAKLTAPVEETLYFAGEHTDITGHWGTVHAAIGTGARAAEQMLRADGRGGE
jgi:glycine/D-amino acid oxidase-like deaminating enzyme